MPMSHPSLTVRRIAIRQSDSRDAQQHQQNDTIDVFPHRITPRADHAIEDILHMIVAMSVISTTGKGRFSMHEIKRLGAEGLDHPMARFEPAAVVVAEGLIDPGADIYTRVDDLVILPNGSQVPLAAFAPTPFTPMTAAQAPQSRSEMRDTITSQPAMQIALAAYVTTFPSAYAHRFATEHSLVGHAAAARAVRLMQLTKAGGRSASESAWLDFGALRDTSHLIWAFSPDRGWAPERLELGQDIHDLLALCKPRFLELGRRIGEELAGRAPERFTVDAWCGGDDENLSNHARILLRQEIAAVDRIIEDLAPEELLKPAAARRRDKTAHTS